MKIKPLATWGTDLSMFAGHKAVIHIEMCAAHRENILLPLETKLEIITFQHAMHGQAKIYVSTLAKADSHWKSLAI